MPSTNFSSGTLITSTWLNEVNGVVHTLFGAATTPAAGRAALNVPTYSELENKNKIVNGAMNIWQRGSTLVFTTTPTYLCDRFAGKKSGTLTTAYMERTADAPAGFNYALRFGRPNGSTQIGEMRIYHCLTTKNSVWAKGQTVTFSLYYKRGSTNSSTTALVIFGGSGNDQSVVDASTASWNMFTPLYTNSSDSGTFSPTTSWQRFEGNFTVPTNTNQIGFYVSGLEEPSAPTAGSDEFFYITGFQLELGSVASKFEQKTYEADYAACLPYYEKSFYATTTPAQNAGVNSGAWMFPSTKAGASVVASNQIRFETRKRYTPTITTYNPAAANSQPRDVSIAADCSGVGTQDVTDSGFVLYCTANAGTSVGNQIKVHWTADSEL